MNVYLMLASGVFPNNAITYSAFPSLRSLTPHFILQKGQEKISALLLITIN